MPHRYLDAVQKPDQNVNRLFRLMDIRLLEAEEGSAMLAMPVHEDVGQGAGMVAGGVLATLADEAMAHAVLSALPRGQAAVTCEMNVRYLRGTAAAEEGEIRAMASVVKRGRSLWVVEASVTDAAGQPLAVAGGTFFLVKGEA